MPPNDFSNHLARWVYKHSCSSVVYLELRPDPALVWDTWNTVHPIAERGQAAVAVLEKRDEDSGITKCCTGFFVATLIPDPNGLFVLTSAHVLHPVFSANMPITAEQVDKMYEPWLLCGHREENYLGLEGPIQRDLTRGEVRSISCENDLMLLRFPVGQMETYCLHVHRPLAVASEFPRSLKGMVLISWPGVGRRWATAIGTSSQQDRQSADLGEDNSFGFTTRLSEVDITSESGSSGAPLLNGAGHVLGVLHGGNKVFSYFVGLHELRNTATAWGIIVH